MFLYLPFLFVVVVVNGVVTEVVGTDVVVEAMVTVVDGPTVVAINN